MQVLNAREVPPNEDQVNELVVGLLELGDDGSVLVAYLVRPL